MGPAGGLEVVGFGFFVGTLDGGGGEVDHVVEAGHLDYSGDPGVVALVTGLSAELSTRPHLQDPP